MSRRVSGHEPVRGRGFGVRKAVVQHLARAARTECLRDLGVKEVDAGLRGTPLRWATASERLSR
eukprot:3583048-Alexandrium_andersonii.AAC.1